MTERLFPLSTFSPGIAVAGRLGFSFDTIADMAGIQHGLLADPNALVTAHQYHELAALGARLLQNPAFALAVTDLIRLEMFDVIGPLFATTETGRSYLLEAVRFMPLINPCVDTLLDEEGDEARYECVLLPEQGADNRFFHAEAVFGTGHRLMQQVFHAPHMSAFRFEFQHDGSAWLQSFRDRFGDELEIVFNAPRNIAYFHRAVLDLRNPAYSPTVHAHMLKLAEARLASLPNVDSASTLVLRVLEQEAGRRVMDIGDVAAQLGMSTRTLQRRLVDEHTSFQKVRDGLRMRQAQAMLRDPSVDFVTIAATLGFSEPASFHRAFKAWTGLSPTEYRRQQPGAE